MPQLGQKQPNCLNKPFHDIKKPTNTRESIKVKKPTQRSDYGRIVIVRVMGLVMVVIAIVVVIILIIIIVIIVIIIVMCFHS